MTATAPPPRLEVRDVSVTFGGIHAVRDVSMSIAPGEVRGFIGPNGAGKTTLFDVISGIRRPSRGSIHLDGHDISSEAAMARARRGLRRTFQRQQPFAWLSVEDNVLAAIEWRRGGGGLLAELIRLPSSRHVEQERRRFVDELLTLCQLDRVRHEPAGNLPIGKVRLVEFARALADQPRILLLDEPTSGLETAERELIAHLVNLYRLEQDCSVVVVEHDIEFVLTLCDSVTVLERGSVIFDGDPESARQNVEVQRAYLG
jgi:branched-chain amino acid transport system ATP-binding protein